MCYPEKFTNCDRHVAFRICPYMGRRFPRCDDWRDHISPNPHECFLCGAETFRDAHRAFPGLLPRDFREHNRFYEQIEEDWEETWKDVFDGGLTYFDSRTSSANPSRTGYTSTGSRSLNRHASPSRQSPRRADIFPGSVRNVDRRTALGRASRARENSDIQIAQRHAEESEAIFSRLNFVLTANNSPSSVENSRAESTSIPSRNVDGRASQSEDHHRPRSSLSRFTSMEEYQLSLHRANAFLGAEAAADGHRGREPRYVPGSRPLISDPKAATTSSQIPPAALPPAVIRPARNPPQRPTVVTAPAPGPLTVRSSVAEAVALIVNAHQDAFGSRNEPLRRPRSENLPDYEEAAQQPPDYEWLAAIDVHLPPSYSRRDVPPFVSAPITGDEDDDDGVPIDAFANLGWMPKTLRVSALVAANRLRARVYGPQEPAQQQTKAEQRFDRFEQYVHEDLF